MTHKLNSGAESPRQVMMRRDVMIFRLLSPQVRMDVNLSPILAVSQKRCLQFSSLEMGTGLKKTS